jgi:NADPH-dependent glutamate synthase beta subunit-like oxidoreductase
VSVPVPPIWTTGTTEAIRTGTWRAALPRHIRAPSPCRLACPVNSEIARWICLARAGDWRAAWEVLTRHNPFPAVAGRICHHPCETACNRNEFDEAVSICRLERAVGDRAIEEGWRHAPPAEQRGTRIAIVGGGPSGLSAAYQLRRMGHAVTLIEARGALGGLMRHGIPPYRLSRAVLDAEIARIIAMGVDVRLSEKLDRAQAWEELRSMHDAIFIATGAQMQKRLPALDYRRQWVIDGATYLAAFNSGSPPALGRRLVVVGGGSAALDAARSARRAGHDVTILALEARMQMPAQRVEVEEALEEGIALRDGAMLLRAQEEGQVVRLACTRVHFAPGSRPGLFRVTPVRDGTFELVADGVITSIGQDPDRVPLGNGYRFHDGVMTVDERQATGVPGVWAGGDIASRARFVTEAIAQGRRAASDIDRWLRASPGNTAAVPDAGSVRVTEVDDPVRRPAIAVHHHAQRARAGQRRIDAAERLAGIDEVQLGLQSDAAIAEAGRCFSCGACTLCDNCVIVCPDLAVRRAGGGYEVLGEYCKGCGLCVRECPTGSMDMVEELR